MDNKLQIMLDTNACDKLLDSNIDISLLKNKCDIYITHIQEDELAEMLSKQSKDKIIKYKKIISSLNKINTQKEPTSNAIFNISSWDYCYWGNEETNEVYDKMFSKSKNHKDCLIAITAITNNMILITNDKELYQIVNNNSGKALEFEELLNLLK